MAERNVVELWWDAMRSDEMLTSGVPTLARSSSEYYNPPSFVTAPAINDPPREGMRKRKKKQKTDTPAPNTLLYHMNNNVRTLRRVRTTHAKFTALTQSLEEGGAGGAPPFINDIPDDVDDIMDERPWKPVGRGIDMGEEHANDCLHWMGGKVLEHSGFQGESLPSKHIQAFIRGGRAGTSKVALDVLSSVTAEYLLNVGRTIRFLCDKYGNQMTSEVRSLIHNSRHLVLHGS